MDNNFCIGLDLGQSSDLTSLAVVEKSEGNGVSPMDPGAREDRPGRSACPGPGRGLGAPPVAPGLGSHTTSGGRPRPLVRAATMHGTEGGHPTERRGDACPDDGWTCGRRQSF